MSTLTMREPAALTVDDVRRAKVSSRRLAPFSKKKLNVRIAGTNETVELPAVAVRLLVDLLTAMAEGNAVRLIPIQAELSRQRICWGCLGRSWSSK